MSTHITLPIPPSVNHYWKRRNGGGMYISAAGMAFKEACGRECTSNGLTPLSGRVALTVTVYRAKDQGDLDNYLKALLDGIKGYAYHDDRQVYAIYAYKDLDRNNPRVELTVEEIPGQPKRRTLF